MTQLTVLSKTEVYIFRGRGVIIDVYKADDKIATSGATSLADIDLRRTYRTIDSVATGRIPSLFCGFNEEEVDTMHTMKSYTVYTCAVVNNIIDYGVTQSKQKLCTRLSSILADSYIYLGIQGKLFVYSI